MSDNIFIATSSLSLLIGLLTWSGQYDIYNNEVLHFILRRWEIFFNYTLILLVGIGLTGVVGILFLFHAYRIASPASIAPFEYILIFYAVVFAWILWGETITFQIWIGLFFIVGGGIYTFFREIKNQQLLSAKKPLR